MSADRVGPARCAALPGLIEPPLDPTGSPTYSICPCCGDAVRRRRSRQAARRAAQGVGAGGRGVVVAERARARRLGRQRAAPGGRFRRWRSAELTRAPPPARRAPGRATSRRGSGSSICRRSSRACWRCAPSRASTSSSPPSGSCPTGCAPSACITCTSDDALFVALDEGTKAAPVEVVYARSFYAGVDVTRRARCRARRSASTRRAIPTRLRAALDACVRTLERGGVVLRRRRARRARVLSARRALDGELPVARRPASPPARRWPT